jgi:hypothetical protein
MCLELIVFMSDKKEKFTEEDIVDCWDAHVFYLMGILNGDYNIDEAREDLRSLIGSKYDPRLIVGK